MAGKDFWSTITDWLAAHSLTILIIVATVLVLQYFASKFIEKVVRRAVKQGRHASTEAEMKRENTIIRIFNGLFLVIIWAVGGMMLLAEMGVNVAPLLAAAGVAGLAFGFGAQYLIRDVIAGFFLIAENQYRVGDVASINGTGGLVEDITLRMTTLRDLDGVVHHIPNGSANEVANMTKIFSRVNIDVGIAYDTKLDKVIRVINKVGDDMAKDKQWKDDIIEPPAFLRVDDFADSAIIVKILGETKPARQWDVAGEFRKRLKLAFDREGIEIPFPQRVIHQAR